MAAQTASTCGPPGSERKITSAAAASASSELAAFALVSDSAAIAEASRSSISTAPACFLATFRHIGPPMTPSPTKPMVRLSLTASIHQHAAVDVEHRSGDPVRRRRAKEQNALCDVLGLA